MGSGVLYVKMSKHFTVTCTRAANATELGDAPGRTKWTTAWYVTIVSVSAFICFNLRHEPSLNTNAFSDVPLTVTTTFGAA
jgi:hypothetical protein